MVTKKTNEEVSTILGISEMKLITRKHHFTDQMVKNVIKVARLLISAGSGNRHSTAGGHTHSLVRTGTQGKEVTPEETGPDLPASVGGSPAKLESGLLWGWGYWEW